jgi:hypothetical protein
MAEAMSNPFERGPFLQVAALCEKVLYERDGVVSLIRLIDTIAHTERGPDAPQVMPEVRSPLVLLVSLKAGVTRGRHELSITPELPSGATLTPISVGVQMEADARGVNVATPIDIAYRLEGLYWFTVRFNGTVLTRVPLEVRYTRLATGLH